MPEVGIVAALRFEARGSVRHWRTDVFTHEGRTVRCFHSANVVLVFGGMGRESARQAAESLVWKFGPRRLVSLGFAGAVSAELRVGDLLFPARVHSDRGEVFLANAERASGTLVTVSGIAGPEQKRELRRRFSADAVDMEAAGVARVALTHSLEFLAVKAISDEPELVLPPFERFVREDGSIDVGAFALFAGLRPRLWPSLARLTRNAAVASAALGRWLAQYNEESPVRPGREKEMAQPRGIVRRRQSRSRRE